MPAKIPNSNDSLMSQAKYVLYQQHIRNESDIYELNEIGLTKMISTLHSQILKQKEEEGRRELKELQIKYGKLE